MVALSANAVLASLKPPGVEPPGNFSRTITLSSTDGVPPFLSLFVDVTHSPPSGDFVTERSRPQRPENSVDTVPTPVPAELICVANSCSPVTAAM